MTNRRNSTALAEQDGTPQAEYVESFEIASIPSRILAAGVDYFVIKAFLSLTARLLSTPDYDGLITLLFGAIYFSLGNSRISRGQTLGKRAFGLRVISTNTDSHSAFLSLRTSFLRYFIAFGLIILCAELPNIIYRKLALVGPPLVLELHMLFVVCFFLTNVFYFLLTSRHQALHDRLVKTLVIRGGKGFSKESVKNFLPSLPTRTFLKTKGAYSHPLLWGAVIGVFLWILGIIHSPEVNEIQRHRFLIENRFPIRITSLRFYDSHVQIIGIILSDGEEALDLQKAKKILAEKLTSFILQQKIVDGGRTKDIQYQLYSSNASTRSGNEQITIPVEETFER